MRRDPMFTCRPTKIHLVGDLLDGSCLLQKVLDLINQLAEWPGVVGIHFELRNPVAPCKDILLANLCRDSQIR